MRYIWYLIAVLWPATLLADTVIPSDRVTTGVNIREQATSNRQSLGLLRPGEPLDYGGSEGRWRQVRLPDGRPGFVSKSWTTRQRGLATRDQDELRIDYLNIGGGSCAVVEWWSGKNVCR